MYVLQFWCGSPNEFLLRVACTVVKYRRVIVTDPLPDDVFLDIFDLCLRSPVKYPAQRMREWLVLAHVCQRWRRIIFSSPRRLDLYLACICGTPVRQNLIYWPLALPIVIIYPGTVSRRDPTPGDENNIVAALTHAGRVHRVDIYAKSSLFGKVATIMQKSFPVLTHLELAWDQEDFRPFPSLPQGFLGGSAPRLEYLYLSGVSFPGLPILLSASNLLTLRFNDIMQSIPPETMVAGLAVLTRLRSLSIEFDRRISPPDQGRSRSNRPIPIILPALTVFHYQGYSEYLEDLLALINMPLVHAITIEYFMGEIQVLQLSRFIGRTKNLKDAQFRRAYVAFYDDQVNVELELGVPQREPQTYIRLALQTPWLDIQVPYVVDVLSQGVAIFSNAGHLFTHASCLKCRDIDNPDSIEWLPFLRLFSAVETLRLSGDMVPYIASALEDIPEEMVTEVMPALHLLWLDEEDRTDEDKPVGSIERFLTLRQLSGCPVTVVNTKDEFYETLNILKAHRRCWNKIL